MNTYNHHLPQKALGHISPIAVMKQWQAKRPDLFVKPVYKQAGLDIVSVSVGCSYALGFERSRGDELLHQVDKLLYAAKAQGRNRVVLGAYQG